MSITIELPSREEQVAFNRQRWAEVVEDSTLARFAGKVETNRHGQVLMSPPPSGAHSSRQTRILLELHKRLGGRPLAECPVSTADGVRSVDVGWYSEERFREVEDQLVFVKAPEICVEVASPGNTPRELREKTALYFEAGAEEVWICDLEGSMVFFVKRDPHIRAKDSMLCPGFPATF